MTVQIMIKVLQISIYTIKLYTIRTKLKLFGTKTAELYGKEVGEFAITLYGKMG